MITLVSQPRTSIIVETAMRNTMAQYVVAYAKIVADKEGITLQGVYFGGIGNTLEEAEQIARECVNTLRGGTILPRIIKLNEDLLIIDSLYDAEEKFARIVKNMIESDQIINRSKRK